jgi:hypothetical protein
MNHSTSERQHAPASSRHGQARATRRTWPVIALLSAGALGMRKVLKKHNASLHSAATALNETVSAPGSYDGGIMPDPDQTTGHARGHRHVSPDDPKTSVRMSHRAWRRWATRADQTGHPPRA